MDDSLRHVIKLLEVAKSQGIKNGDFANRIGSARLRITRWKNNRAAPPPEFVFLCKMMLTLNDQGVSIPDQIEMVLKWESSLED